MISPRTLAPWAAAALLALGASCSTLESPRTESVPFRTYDAETFFGTTSVAGASFSADGSRILVSSDETGVFNAWAIDADSGARTQLTHSTGDAIFALSYFPADDRFLYRSNEGGNELDHLYVQETDGSVVDLTPGEKLKAGFLGWHEDDRSFYVTTNERDARYFDLYRYDVPPQGASNGYTRELVYENASGFDVSSVSPDGRWVALTKVRNNADSDVFLWDARNPGFPPIHVTPHEGNVSHSVETFSPDSGTLYYSSNEGSEWQRVYSYGLSDARRQVAHEASWDISYLRFSEDGRFRVLAVNADARTEVSVHDLRRDRPVRLPSFPGANLGGLAFDEEGERLALYVNGDTQPSNLYVYDVRGERARALTDTLNPEIDPNHLVASRVVRFESFDGTEIPGLLYRPKLAGPDNKVPALLFMHGGPGGQSRTGYRAMIQHLVNHGYAIFAVNNRGSSGYGKTFYHMDDLRHGDVDLKDCVWARRYLEGLDWIDGEKVGIMGGSYGGYLVAAALAFEPEAFDIGIDIFGVTNWLRTLESIPPWWEDFREALYAELGDPEKDREALEAKSPLFHADKIRRPLLVVQGANDPRVLQEESDEIVAAVRRNGVPCEYLLFDDEGHGFRKKANRILASETYLRFADRYLRGIEPAPSE